MAQVTGRKGSSLYEVRKDSFTDVGTGRARCYRARKKAQEVEIDAKCSAKPEKRNWKKGEHQVSRTDREQI